MRARIVANITNIAGHQGETGSCHHRSSDDAKASQLTSLIDSVIIYGMRTTVNLDDDVLQMVKKYAESRSLGMGKAVSELVRRGISAPRPTRSVNGLKVFDLPADSPPVTTRAVRRLEAEEQ